MKDKLDIYEFGRQLLETGDLDPVYILLWEAQLEPEFLQRFLIAYWAFYHVGTASWIVDQPDYWGAMERAAGSKYWPRSAERRHYRGENACKSVAYLKNRGVSGLFEPLLGVVCGMEYITQIVQTWVGFGPWIAFKVADMLERLDLADVRFTVDSVLYDSPLKGARDLWAAESGTPPPEDVGSWAVEHLMDNLGSYKAPPRYERLCNPQEMETCLCKHHSYLGGHYHVGEDVTACRRGLLRFARCKTAQRLLVAGKKGGIW